MHDTLRALSRPFILTLLLGLSGAVQAQDGSIAFHRASLEAVEDWPVYRLLDSTQVWVGPPLMLLKKGDLISVDVRADRYARSVYGIEITMDSSAAVEFSELTSQNQGQNLAIVVDKNVLSAPAIRERIPEGRVYIDGLGGIEEAMWMAEVIHEAADVPAYSRPRVRPEEIRLVTPEDAARSYLRATSLGDWESSVDMLHPSSLAFNAALVDDLEFVNGRVLLESIWPGNEMESQEVIRSIPVSVLLNEVPAGPLPESLSREQRVVLLMRTAEIQGQLRIDPDMPTIVGSIIEGEAAYVVLRQSMSHESVPFNNMGVIHLGRVDSEWRVRSTTLLHP